MGVRLDLSIASGVLFALALAPHHWEGLGWIAFVPLLWAVSAPLKSTGKPPRALHSYGLGMAAGLASGVVQIGWHPSQSALTFAYVPYIWIALVLGGVSALAGWGHRQKFGTLWPLWAACAGVFVEWLTTFSPLPVGIALCQTQNLPLLQISAYSGIWGVSFLLWLVNAALVNALLRPARRAVPVPLFAAIGLTAGVWGFGAWTLGHLPAPLRTLRVAAIQDFSGVDAHDFAPAANLEGDVPDGEALTRQAAKNGAELIVGTENALGASFTPGNPQSETARLARETKSFLVVGYEANAEPHPFNCAALVGPDGKTIGVHHKLRLFLGEKQTMQPGTSVETWDTALGKVGVLICFDTCYTGDMRRVVQKGAQIIAVPNYDPPTPGNSLHNLHAALVPFRAVENGVALVRADPNGQSQIIDPQGRTVAVSPMFRAVSLTAPVALGNGQGTFFTRWGDWFAYGCVAGMAVLAAPMVMDAFTQKKAAPYAAAEVTPLSSQPRNASAVEK